MCYLFSLAFGILQQESIFFSTPCCRILCILPFGRGKNLEDLFDGLQNDGLEGAAMHSLGRFRFGRRESARIVAPPRTDESSTF